MRPWKDEDAMWLYEYAKDPQVGPTAGWPVHTSVENSRELICHVLSAPETYAVVHKETGHPIGSIGLKMGEATDLAAGDREAELGYWIGVPFWGQGLIPEAAEVLLGYAFGDLHLDAVWCGCYDGNEKSARVQQKLGFGYQYTKENAECSLLNEVRTEHISRLTREEWNHDRF